MQRQPVNLQQKFSLFAEHWLKSELRIDFSNGAVTLDVWI